MKAVDAATSFWVGSEEFLGANSIMFTLVVKEPIVSERLYPTYRKLVLENPMLQSKLVDQPGQKSMEWTVFSPQELEALLQKEAQLLAHRYSHQEVIDRYDPINTRLPFNVSQVDDRTLVFKTHHALLNGRAGVYWIDRWLAYYSGQNVPADSSTERPRVKFGKLLASCSAAISYIVRFNKRAGKHSQAISVDLSAGRPPVKQAQASRKAYHFTSDETSRVLQVAREQDMTLTQYVHAALSRAFFETATSEERLVTLGVMDLHEFVGTTPGRVRGNVTANLPIQLYKGTDLRQQIREAYHWLVRGAGFGINTVLGTLLGSFDKRRKTFATQCEPPLSARDAMTGTFGFSNIGVVELEHLAQCAESFSACLKTQTFFILAVTLNNQLSFDICLSHDLFSPELFELSDRVLTPDYLCSQEGW